MIDRETEINEKEEFLSVSRIGSELSGYEVVSVLSHREELNIYAARDEEYRKFILLEGFTNDSTDKEAFKEFNFLPEPHGFIINEKRRFLIFQDKYGTSLKLKTLPPRDEDIFGILRSIYNITDRLFETNYNPFFNEESLFIEKDLGIKLLSFPEKRNPEKKIEKNELVEKISYFTEYILREVFFKNTTQSLNKPYYERFFLSGELKDFIKRLADSNISWEETGEVLKLYTGEEEVTIDMELKSHPGMKRERNEDSVIACRTVASFEDRHSAYTLLAVADGMGGYEKGEVASRMTLKLLAEKIWSLFHKRDKDITGDNRKMKRFLEDLLDEINKEILAISPDRKKPAGSTLVFALLLNKRLFIVNVGDSRAYFYRNNSLVRLTKDHSLVQQMVDRGEITEEEAFESEDSNYITSYIGMRQIAYKDIYLYYWTDKSMILLSSDGLHGMLRDDEMEEFFNKSRNLNILCRYLVNEANKAGGEDNISLIVARRSPLI